MTATCLNTDLHVENLVVQSWLSLSRRKSNMYKLRKKKTWSDSGVSEIIGNILILLITVVLFSTIMAFVNQMPVPEQAIKADFKASLTYSGSTSTLTVTHAGGEPLKAEYTAIQVDIDGQGYGYTLSNEPAFGRATWSTGIEWSKTYTNVIQATSSVLVRVVDLTEHVVVWASQVSGGTGGSPPTIMQRYSDSNYESPTPDAIKQGDTFSVYVKITDFDGDLDIATSSIYIDASSIGLGPAVGYAEANSSWYRWFFNVAATTEMDGKSLIIHASDLAGHQTISSFQLSITILPIEPQYNYYPAYTELGSSGLPAYLSFVSGNHGFGVYGEKDLWNLTLGWRPTGEANTSDARVVFVKDEYVFIRYASLVMSNLFAENRLVLTDTRTGLTYTPVYNGSSTASAPFYPHPTGGGAYVYECQFNTSGLLPSAYSMLISLKSQPATGEVQNSFQTQVMISLTQTGSPVETSLNPEITVYNDEACTTEWGTKDHPFNISSTENNKVYVKIRVQDTDNVPPSPRVAEVRITDLSGSSQVFGIPPAGSMISSIKRYDGTHYNFSIDLRLNNGAQWLAGNNSYTLFVSKLNDTNEGMYSMSKQIFVVGYGSRAEFFVGSSGMSVGNDNFNTREYLYYIQNSAMFPTKVMWLSESTPSSSTDFTITAMAAGDYDGDGDNDIIAGRYGPSGDRKLYLFENTLNTFGTWQSASSISRPETNAQNYFVAWIDFGDVNGDGHPDFAYANSNNPSDIVIYNTTYGSTGWWFRPAAAEARWSGTVSKLALEDMTGDGKCDLVVLASGVIFIYDLKYAYDPVLKVDEATRLLVKKSSGTGTSDFDIMDMDGDGDLDILTTGTSQAPFTGGGSGVNVNYLDPTVASTKYLDVNYEPDMTYGEYVTGAGEIGRTQNPDGGANQYITFREYASGGDAGKVSAVVKTLQLTNTPDQHLSVRARVGGSVPAEAFYIWYSLDGVKYIPVISVTSTTWAYYNYTLPEGAANKALHLMITDSSTPTVLPTPQNYLDIDFLAVYTYSVGYSGKNVDTSTSWTCVRGGDMDKSGTGYQYREVVLAKDLTWTVYVSSATGTWSVMAGDVAPNQATFHTKPPLGNQELKTYFDGRSATLFDIVDINGDGYYDVLVTNYTTSTPYLSEVGFFMNLYDGEANWRYFRVGYWSMGSKGANMPPPLVDIVLAIVLSET